MMADPATRKNAFVCGVPEPRFYAGYPLFTAEGKVFGSLGVVDLQTRPEGLSQPESDGLEALARQAMRLMEMRRETVAQERRLTAQQIRRERAARQARRQMPNDVTPWKNMPFSRPQGRPVAWVSMNTIL